jgi:hypothetical protein
MLASQSRFAVDELAAIEAGERALTDVDVDDLLAVYGVQASSLVPERSQLVVDLDDRALQAGAARRPMAAAAPTADEVLATYLSLIYALRHARPGSPLTLRDADLAVLSLALELSETDIERRLHELMVDRDGALGKGVSRVRSRLLLPVVGVVVAVTAAGTLLLVQATGDETDATPLVVDAPGARLGPASFEISAPAGGDGLRVIVGDGIPADEIPPGAVNLGVAQVAERHPDGTVTQSARTAEPSGDETSDGG